MQPRSRLCFGNLSFQLINQSQLPKKQFFKISIVFNSNYHFVFLIVKFFSIFLKIFSPYFLKFRCMLPAKAFPSTRIPLQFKICESLAAGLLSCIIHLVFIYLLYQGWLSSLSDGWLMIQLQNSIPRATFLDHSWHQMLQVRFFGSRH